MSYLKYISDENLISAVRKIIDIVNKAENQTEKQAIKTLHQNVLDPFSALFDGVTNSISYNKWIQKEKMRQAQKTMQNAIGDFHQEIIGLSLNSENLGAGGGLDVRNNKLKIIAEIKNKYNTTKGNHKIEVYDAIKSMLKHKEYSGFTGYYVEIISQGKKEYNKPFTPPDNKTKKHRPVNEKIRVIDGKSFYALMTGYEFALQELFEVLPKVISNNFKYNLDANETTKYLSLFEMAFNVK